jgi:hypothetical protein
LLSVFAARDSAKPGRVSIIVINKHLQPIYDGVFTIGAEASQTRARTYVMDSSGPALHPGADVAISNGQFRFSLAPLSATLLVCE